MGCEPECHTSAAQLHRESRGSLRACAGRARPGGGSRPAPCPSGLLPLLGSGALLRILITVEIRDPLQPYQLLPLVQLDETYPLGVAP